MHFLRNILLSFSLVFLASCSSYNIGYYFGDWLLKRKVTEYLKLYGTQKENLGKDMESYMKWHEANMLSTYDQYLKNLESFLKKKEIGPFDILPHVKGAIDLYYQTAHPFMETLTPYLVVLNSDQVDALKKKIYKANEKRKKDLSISKLPEKTLADLKSILVKWIGPMTGVQEKYMANWLRIEAVSPQKVFERRLMHQKTFFSLMEIERKDQRKIELEKYFKKFFSSEREGIVFQQKRMMSFSVLFAGLYKLMDINQKNHLTLKIKEYRNILGDLKD